MISVLIIWLCLYVELSLVLLEKGICYDQCVLLAKLCQPLSCFILYPKAKLSCYFRHLLTSYFCIPVSYNERTSFFWCQFQKVLQIFIELFNFNFVGISGWGIDLDYCDTECFALQALLNLLGNTVFKLNLRVILAIVFHLQRPQL